MYQLIYTSAPKLLEAGKTGFGTVARSRDLPTPLVLFLERISTLDRGVGVLEYETYCSYNLGRDVFHIFTHIADCGADYTGRTNHLAQHFVVEETTRDFDGMRNSTPAGVLMSLRSMWMRQAWSRGPVWLPEVDAPAQAPLGSAGAWNAHTGQADNAQWLNTGNFSSGACICSADAGVDFAELIHDACLERADHGWGLGFCTICASNISMQRFPVLALGAEQVRANVTPPRGLPVLWVDSTLTPPAESELIRAVRDEEPPEKKVDEPTPEHRQIAADYPPMPAAPAPEQQQYSEPPRNKRKSHDNTIKPLVLTGLLVAIPLAAIALFLADKGDTGRQDSKPPITKQEKTPKPNKEENRNGEEKPLPPRKPDDAPKPAGSPTQAQEQGPPQEPVPEPKQEPKVHYGEKLRDELQLFIKDMEGECPAEIKALPNGLNDLFSKEARDVEKEAAEKIKAILQPKLAGKQSALQDKARELDKELQKATGAKYTQIDTLIQKSQEYRDTPFPETGDVTSMLAEASKLFTSIDDTLKESDTLLKKDAGRDTADAPPAAPKKEIVKTVGLVKLEHDGELIGMDELKERIINKLSATKPISAEMVLKLPEGKDDPAPNKQIEEWAQKSWPDNATKMDKPAAWEGENIVRISLGKDSVPGRISEWLNDCKKKLTNKKLSSKVGGKLLLDDKSWEAFLEKAKSPAPAPATTAGKKAGDNKVSKDTAKQGDTKTDTADDDKWDELEKRRKELKKQWDKYNPTSGKSYRLKITLKIVSDPDSTMTRYRVTKQIEEYQAAQ